MSTLAVMPEEVALPDFTLPLKIKTVADLPLWAFPFSQPHRYKIAKGGRGSSKSWTVAGILLCMGSAKCLRILCAREFQKTIKDSVHKLLKDQIVRLKLEHCYRVTDTAIYCTTGTEFIFAGLHANIASIKSLEGVDICWIEEAETVSADSWKNLIPTIRKDGSEIWVSYNPREPEDPTSIMAEKLAEMSDLAVVLDVNWQDNPFFPETLRKEMEYDYKVDPEAAAWVWGGQFRKRSQAQIFSGKYRVEAFDTPGSSAALVNDTSWDGPWFGADWGFSQDPTVGLKLWGNGNTLYVEHEAYGVGVELNDIAALFKAKLPGIEKGFVVRGDSSRPDTISHVRSFGLNMTPAEKWQGSVEEGIAYLRSLEAIVIHPRCEHTVIEARLYSYKTDRLTGDVLPIVIDKHNHCLSGDTQIETSEGPKAIESLVGRTGILHTPSGPSHFKDVRQTSPREAVYQVTLADGRAVKATAEHVFMARDGWCPVIALQGKELLDTPDAMRYAEHGCRRNSNTPTVSHSLATRKQATTLTRRFASGCIDTYGRAFTVRSPKVITFTTKTKTDQTTPSAILRPSRSARINTTIGCVIPTPSLQQPERLSAKQPPLRQYGIEVKKAGAGTRSTQEPVSQYGERSIANTAAQALRVRLSGRESFALTLASLLHAEHPALITFQGNALCVVPRSSQTVSAMSAPVADHVEQRWVTVSSVKFLGYLPVFNLETDNHTLLIHGGIATHNCWDTIRYALQPAIRTAEREIRVVHEEQVSISPELDDIDFAGHDQAGFSAW